MAKGEDLDGRPIKPITICMIGAGGFIGSHLCEKLMKETPHTVLALDVYDEDKISALDGYDDKIKHLLEPYTVEWKGRLQFHRINIKDGDSRFEELIKKADLTINLAATCTPAPAERNTRTRDTIYSNFMDAVPIVKCCSENKKRLIHFSTSDVYGETIGSYLPKDDPLREDTSFSVLKEDMSPCILGSIGNIRWAYACAQQLTERLIYAAFAGPENSLEYTIVRPFNWIGPRMDFIPGIDGSSNGVPRVLAYHLIREEPLKLVDGGESRRTFIYIDDAIEAILLMIENPERANGHIFNVGNPNNEVTVRQLAEMMAEVYAKVSGGEAIENPTVDVSSKEIYGKGYEDSHKGIPDTTIINRQLGWNPTTSLWDLLESTLTYQHRTYAEAVRNEQIEENKQKLRQRSERKDKKRQKKNKDKMTEFAAQKKVDKSNATKKNQANRSKGTGKKGENVAIEDDKY
ncbi:hypothetical protein EUTSA_v10025153mg [Eutrema salsugineum]|uniref:NAD-dependent epimerase/dehydratase domain-containing protein n=1 Tax=Eutrema salsugineum TaxID=72664 RepID=V4MF66_EUTSA|nr:UDP-D-apiose/UDP-D-xylose synthase 1 isoform X2 [Eutrema salsugineum]XP_024005045.1 UDP-D-apiose/UDP-D-xylose synthase 1 isoform X2 [Eutrema salsugineum]XP_024005046.1 UDP-D-apiose/UDP-D-xylose synthase 1 isoform X2 [Eutrema salsugineum]ESQ53917.1 hypothetical protein EUTSA_v10025153mg [Eutrema salsugineum]